MKKSLLLIFLSFVALAAGAQESDYITFDPTDTAYMSRLSRDTVHYHHNSWQIGAPHKTYFTSAFSAPNTIVTDTAHPYPVNDTSVFTLKMPLIARSSWTWGWPMYIQATFMNFNYQLKKDTGDIARLEVSLDNGANWYDSKDTLPGGLYQLIAQNLSDTTSGWTNFRIDFPMSGTGDTLDTVLFRFTFISDSINTGRDGWMIDNILEFYYAERISSLHSHGLLTLYPNPVTNKLTITSTLPVYQLAITDVTGQPVYSRPFSSKTVEADLSELPPGIYFARINGDTIRQFVKQ